MRLVGLTLSAALLSGCSWLGGSGQGVGHNPYASQQAGYYGAPAAGAVDPCQVAHAQAAIPRGCAPHQVTIGTNNAFAGGFAQQPQFGQPGNYADAGYGSHAGGNTHTSALRGQATQSRLRKPRWRAQVDLGMNQSIGGDLLDYDRINFDPISGYEPNDYREGRVTGSPNEGAVVQTEWRANSRLASNPNPYDEINRPSISFDDAWSAPTTLGIGGEMITDRATLFARVGYSRAQGNQGDVATVQGTVYQDTETDFYERSEVIGPTGFPELGPPTLFDTTNSTQFITNQNFTRFNYDFSDMERIDLEAGGRLYMKPIAGQRSGKTVTPFVGASAGASHYNGVSVKVDQSQLSYSSVFEGDEPEYYDLDGVGYDTDGDPATPPTSNVDLYDSQWVPTGRLAAGVEWQVTPKTALAFETGVRFEGARDYSDGTQGDANISIPVTLRGSFNF